MPIASLPILALISSEGTLVYLPTLPLHGLNIEPLTREIVSRIGPEGDRFIDRYPKGIPFDQALKKKHK